MEVSDTGVFFNPLEADPPDLSLSLAERPIGRLGVFLAKSLVESRLRTAGRRAATFCPSFPADPSHHAMRISRNYGTIT